MNNNVVERIKGIMDHYSLNSRTLAKELGYNSSEKISRLFREGNAKPSYDILFDIANKFDINTDWFITGRGNMLKEPKQTSTAIKTDNKEEGIPLIPISAMAGAFAGEVQILEAECDRYIVPSFRGADFLITAKGDSMAPTYNSGDMVACKNLPINDLFFQWNKVYVIDTDQGVLIKRIMPGESEEWVTIVSDNPEYPPFQLPRKKIYHIALVIGVIRLI